MAPVGKSSRGFKAPAARFLAAAALALAGAPVGSRAGPSVDIKACPILDPYSTEPSPFGWPLSPSDWAWSRPDCWDKAHVICGGKRQSPIDIDMAMPECEQSDPSGPDGLLAGSDVSSYRVAEVGMVHISKYMGTVQVAGDLGHINLGVNGSGVSYDAFQLHLAAPSIHTIEGKHFDAEMMIFHRPHNAKDMLTSGVIVSVLYSYNETATSGVFDALGFADDDQETLQLAPNWGALHKVDLPGDLGRALGGRSYLYDGSVPVPPCSENVKWIVLGTPQPVAKRQVEKLRKQLAHHAGPVKHRESMRRDRHGRGGECRKIAVNSLQVGGSHEADTCRDLKTQGKGLLSATCWDFVNPCWNKRYSAADISTDHAVAWEDETAPNVHHDEKIVHYQKVDHVKVSPSQYSLDAIVDNDNEMMKADGENNFGHLLLNGHLFFAASLSFKVISQHTLNGKHYAGELQIEHVLFGDTFGSSYSPDKELHKVMVNIFLQVGRENTLLRYLGVSEKKRSIRDGVPYEVLGAVDLAEELAPALSGPWYWYSSNSTHRGCGSSVRYMVFERPLEVSPEQLNALSLQVSGLDSSQLPRAVTKGNLWKEHLPAHAVELNETACERLPTTTLSHGIAHPYWDHSNERCWSLGYPLCSSGQRQSPINIPTGQLSKVGEQNFLAKCSWKPVSELDVLNTGHSLQVNSDQMGYVTLMGENGFPEYFHVAQFHLHMPSEHMINGRQYAAELHIVHKKQTSIGVYTDDLLVAAIMFDVTGENSTLLQQLFLPGADSLLYQEGLNPKNFLGDGMVVDEVDERERIAKPIDLMRATGEAIDGPFYRYNGSLTTPPCSETVKWFVFGTPLAMSQEQWASFKALYPNPENNRPIQPLHGRDVAMNSFLDGEMKQYGFYLNRYLGRNRVLPDERAILVPIIGSAVFAIFVMAAVFVREDRMRMMESAGGLAEPVKRSSYANMP